MPVLAAYFGISVVDAVLYYDPENYEFIKFPYPYNTNINRGFINEPEYNKQVLELILKQRKKKLSDFKVITAGYLTEPKLTVETKLTSTVPFLLNSIEKINPVFVNIWSITLRDKTISRVMLNNSFGQNDLTVFTGALDFFSTLSVYSQVCPIEMSTRAHIDQELVEAYYQSGSIFYSDFPIVFTGDRFSQFVKDKELDYIFILSLLNKTGLYDILIDPCNALILSQLLKSLSKDILIDYDDILQPVGTLLSTSGYTECMLEKEVGTRQLFEVGRNELFIVPLDRDIDAKLMAKSHETDTLEREIKGGTMGLIIDTREIKNTIASDIKMFNNSIKEFDRILRGL